MKLVRLERCQNDEHNCTNAAVLLFGLGLVGYLVRLCSRVCECVCLARLWSLRLTKKVCMCTVMVSVCGASAMSPTEATQSRAETLCVLLLPVQ